MSRITQQVKGPGQKSVTGQDCLGLTKEYMISRFSPAQFIVIHGRKVVMDQ